MSDSWLSHTGVKGMRWGVRKDRKASQLASVKKMSTKEINDILYRHEVEQKYIKYLSDLDKSRQSAARKLTSKILSKVGDKVLEKAAEKAAAALVNKVLSLNKTTTTNAKKS